MAIILRLDRVMTDRSSSKRQPAKKRTYLPSSYPAGMEFVLVMLFFAVKRSVPSLSPAYFLKEAGLIYRN